MDAPSSASSYSNWSNSALVARVSELERQLKEQTAKYNPTSSTTEAKAPSPTKKPKAPPRGFDPTKYSTRQIALKFAYLGKNYNGYEHAKRGIYPLPTIEEALWQAVRRARLISPPTSEPIEESNDWLKERVPKALDINWDGCQYSKCGRTDRGVSAFGQVIGVRVRSNKPLEEVNGNGKNHGRSESSTSAVDIDTPMDEELDVLPDIDSADLQADKRKSFDSIQDELPYVQILNSNLPPDIRILAWCPHPPPDFDARFSCKERQYKYIFTNPAFTPTPGSLGFQFQNGQASKHREGWLDIEAMREGAKMLVGLHDFRNFCKVDSSKQITDFHRRIFHADIELLNQNDGPAAYVGRTGFTADKDSEISHVETITGNRAAAPQVYAFVVHGSAFLWHQVRHMAAVLFLIGQGLEPPELITDLLDIEKIPRRPMYEIASDAPLILWNCVFPAAGGGQRIEALDWVYAGDSRQFSQLHTKDGKFGVGGIVDDMWKVWRQRKIDEVLAGTLLNLVAQSGEGENVDGNSHGKAEARKPRSQRVFDGDDQARLAGKYIPVMKKRRMDTVEVQNAKYLAVKSRRGVSIEADD